MKYEPTTLKETVDYMLSDSYIDRFKAEYHQVKMRYQNLQKMIIKYEANTLDFIPKCSIDILKDQKRYMGCYLYQLELRAEIENINLKEK